MRGTETFAGAAEALAAAAALLLGWRPDEFWRATPGELAGILGALRSPPPITLSRSDLDALMKRYPDG